jgi:hypothetical protein
MDGLFIPLSSGELAQVLNRVKAHGHSPDSHGVRAFLLENRDPPRPQGRHPILHLAMQTIDTLNRL